MRAEWEMAKQPVYMENFKRLTRTSPAMEHVEDIDRELYGSGNDRATAVMLGSFLETSLERLLKSVMRADLNNSDRSKLFEYEGAAGSFSSKTILAYALGLIGPISRHDLDILRTLRNEFAHSRMHFSFDTPETRAVCDQLQIVNQYGSFPPARLIAEMPEKRWSSGDPITDPRLRFITACNTLSYRMHLKTNGVQAGDIAFPNNDFLP